MTKKFNSDLSFSIADKRSLGNHPDKLHSRYTDVFVSTTGHLGISTQKPKIWKTLRGAEKALENLRKCCNATNQLVVIRTPQRFI
jgi:hypothetical protein